MRVTQQLMASLCVTREVCAAAMAQNQGGAITVFIAKTIITMNPMLPVATAVAVWNGRILGVGSLQSLGPWLKDNKYTTDEQFERCASSAPLACLHSLFSLDFPNGWTSATLLSSQ